MSSNMSQGSIVVTGETASGQLVPKPAEGTPIESLLARIEAIEARQWDYGMHGPGCPARLVEVMNRNGGGPHYTWQPCTCWLSQEDEVVHLIADGEAVTSCCGRAPFELPRTDRITVDPKQANGCG